MGWETRPHSGGRYYTRSKKAGGKVLREYVSGAKAEAAAQADQAARAARAVERINFLKLQRDAADLGAEWGALAARVALLQRATLLSLGYYEHRGQWRKRRVRIEEGKVPAGPSEAGQPRPGEAGERDAGRDTPGGESGA